MNLVSLFLNRKKKNRDFLSEPKVYVVNRDGIVDGIFSKISYATEHHAYLQKYADDNDLVMKVDVLGIVIDYRRTHKNEPTK